MKKVHVQSGIEVRHVCRVYLVGLPSGVEVAKTKVEAEKMVKKYCERTAKAGVINACVVTWTEGDAP